MNMFKDTPAFSGFSVNDLQKAKQFYGDTLGVEVKETEQGLQLHIFGGTMIFVYEKSDHVPATYTILNFVVEDIDKAVNKLVEKGIKFEHYPEMTDEKGIARGLENDKGPNIAWFKDPSGNFLSVLQDK